MPRSPLFIPETPGQLTAEWLTKVLTEQGCLSAEVQTCEQTVLGDGEGFVGDIIKVDLGLSRSDEKCPATVVAKMPKLVNRAMGELLGAYERENMFYMTYADTLPVATPKLYYGEFDRDAASEKQEEILRQAEKIPRFLQGLTNKLAWWIAASKKRRYILLMEDISTAEPIDQLAGVSMGTMQTIVESVAKLHAHFWQREDLADQFWLLPLDIDAKMRSELMHRSQEGFRTMFPDSVAAGLEDYLVDLADTGVNLCHGLSAGPTTLLHCDLRLDNLFFRDGEVLFIDWQLVRHGNPAYDLAYLFSSGLNGEASAEPILARYHEALVSNGITTWSLEDLLVDYSKALRVVLMNLSSVDQVDLGDGRGVKLLEAWIERLRLRLVADSPLN
ncbi:MAG: phosphotransferase [Pseudomonadales bacterium]|nr:phosphotransferase [Pseudomonadales bacterium]